MGEAAEQVTETWVDSIEDEGLKEALGKYESQEQFFETIGYTPPEPEKVDWKDGLDDDLKKVADRFNTKEDAIRAIESYRKKDALIRVPGKDATDEEIAKYHKAIGIPEKPEEYEFPEIDEVTDEIKASRESWGKRLHDLKVPKETAKALIQFVNEDSEKLTAAQIEADKEYAKTQEDVLKSEWKGDFEKNKNLANRAFAELASRAGVPVEEMTHIETKEGRLLLDNAGLLRIFSIVGKEMEEGTLGPSLSSDEKDTLQEEIDSIREQIAKAQAEGNSKKANALYQKEQNLLSKLGDQPIVGAAGRRY